MNIAIDHDSRASLLQTFLVLLFWFLIGILIHAWVAHGLDASFNILQVQNGPLIKRLVHFGYTAVAYGIYHGFKWTGLTALYALGLVSVLSVTIGGWSVYRIGCFLNGPRLGWALSLLAWPLPLFITQAQGQEYQPFATAMMAFAWYFWIVRKSMPRASVAWAISVLANPANALLFGTFLAFMLLEDHSLTSTAKRSLPLWMLSCVLVLAVWVPFYQELLFANDGWAVVPTLSDERPFYHPVRVFKASAYLVFGILTNSFMLFLVPPYRTLQDRFRSAFLPQCARTSRKNVFSLCIALTLAILPLSVFMGSSGAGRYYTPLLLWLILFCMIGLYRLVDEPHRPLLFKRWTVIGILQLLYVVLIVALPYKQLAYARYDDYRMIAERYPTTPVAFTGAMTINHHNRVEQRIKTIELDHKDKAAALKASLETGEIDTFILTYGVDVFFKAFLKRHLPLSLLEKAGINVSDPRHMLKKMGFNVNLEPLPGVKSGEIYLVTARPR